MKGLSAWHAVTLIATGGALGVLLRFGLESVLHDRMASGMAVAVSNISGSLALGFLVARLRTRDRLGSPRSQMLLAFLGTGVLGGYTTYSGLALESVTSAQEYGPVHAGLFLVATVCGGVLACLVGLRLGARSTRR